MTNRALFECFREAKSTGTCFAFWRYSNEKTISFVSNLIATTDFSDEKPAFVFQRFADESKSVYPFDSDFVQQFDLESVVTSSEDFAFTSSDKEIFEAQVKKGIELISENKLTKIVLSRKVSAEVDLDVFASYLQLCTAYPSAFCYLFYSRETGFWMGATPEVLCEISNGVVSSMSLAGTRFATNYQPFSEKEFREQELVTQFISSQLAELVYRVQISDRTEIQAGNLIHLQTIISGRLLENTAIKQVIAALHPTPAVCGLPQQKAFEAIAEIENYDRTYYTGVVGIVANAKQNNIDARLFVNLRCMNYQNNLVTLFAGCGIVAASNPEAEFEETEQKLKTIKRILVRAKT